MTATPSAPEATLLDPDDLPAASLESEGATAICDPEASQLDPEAGDSLVVCYDGLLLGLRALKTTVAVVDRLYLRRPACAGSPCTAEELATVTVTGWSADIATSVVIDWERNRITPPAPDSDASWPTPTSTIGPSVARPDLDGAPQFVREREPLPYCGSADEDREGAMQCFRDAVLDGRPAEMLDAFDVSGGIQVFRYDGSALIRRVAPFGSVWREDSGGLIIGPTFGWSYEEWFTVPQPS